LRFDYKVIQLGLPAASNRLVSAASKLWGKDYCIATLLLQKRTEDDDGNITAKRIGTVV